MQIVARWEWGALPPKSVSAHGTIEGIIAHWVGADLADNPTYEQSCAKVRQLQRDAMAEGYSDIEYSYLIDPVGRIFEGRGASVKQGASNAYNDRTLSWCYMDGPDQDTPFTPAAQAAAAWLSQVLAAFLPKLSYVWPHSKVRPGGTACPGDAIRAFLPTIVLRPTQPPQPQPQPQPVPTPAPGPIVHEFEEADVKATVFAIGKIGDDGNGWGEWDPGLGRDPVIVGLSLQGPYVPGTDGYWYKDSLPIISAQPHGGKVHVSVTHAKPGTFVGVNVSVA